MAKNLNFKVVIAVVLLGMLAHVNEAKPASGDLLDSNERDGCLISNYDITFFWECTGYSKKSNPNFTIGRKPQGTFFVEGPFEKDWYMIRQDSTSGAITTTALHWVSIEVNKENEDLLAKLGY